MAHLMKIDENKIVGYLGWDDLWWNGRADNNPGHHDNSMRLAKRGKVLPFKRKKKKQLKLEK